MYCVPDSISCGLGFFGDSRTNQCKNLFCFANCLLCFGPTLTECLKCSPGSYLIIPSFLYQQFSFMNAYTNFLDDQTDENYKTLTSTIPLGSELYCSTCKEPGHYIDKLKNLCTKCAENCISCESEFSCRKCLPQYYLSQQSKCQKKIPVSLKINSTKKPTAFILEFSEQ